MFFMRITVIWFKRKRMSASRCILVIVLFSYLLTVYISTVLSRKRMLSEAEILPVLWSWRQVLSGNRYVLYMVIENIIMLMPMGLLLPFIINKRNAMIQTMLFGFAFSSFIEVSQKVLNVGFFEVDDLLYNTIGVILGCVASSELKKMMRIKRPLFKLQKRQKPTKNAKMPPTKILQKNC